MADVTRTPMTAEASTVHKPFAVGGKGLWGTGHQLPAYIQSVAHHLVTQGRTESEAIGEAVGIVRNWAHGHDGHGNAVHPDVQAAAAKAMAEWEKLRAEAHSDNKPGARRSAVTVTQRADSKPYGNVTYADPKNGKYPLDSEERCRAAWAYINMPKNADQYPMNGVTLSEVKNRIKAALKKYGVDIAEDSSAAAASRAELFRSCPLEDYHIVRAADGDSSGRVVEAYMTVFGEPAEIHDHQGHYEEDIDRAAFNKRIADLERSRNGFASAKVFYNHGMTIHGSPSDRYSMPVAVCENIRAESRGPITRSRYLDTPLGNEVLEMWRSGAITAQSFTGAIIRSDPQLKPGEKYRPRNGQLPRVRRLELGLKEYGPTPFPAYQGAELVGVRMSPPGTWQAAGGDDEFGDEALPPEAEAAAGEPQEEHSSRYHQHALYALRSRELREQKGLVF